MGRVPEPRNGLSDRQRRFVNEYCTDYNARRAAQAAGYKNPSNQGPLLLKNKYVKAALAKIERQVAERLQLTKEMVLEQLYFMATRTATDFCDEQGRIITNVHKLTKRAQNCIDSIEQIEWTDPNGEHKVKTKLKLVSKTEAINMAMKHFGAYAAEKQEVHHTLDWDGLLSGPQPPDEIEGRIQTLEVKALPSPQEPSDDQQRTPSEGS